MGQSALIGTVFEKLTPADICETPFPHAVIDNALEPGVYACLSQTRPRNAAPKGEYKVGIAWLDAGHHVLR